MQPTDVAVVILKGIREDLQGVRDEVRATNERLDAANERLDGLREHSGVRLDRIARRQYETEVRLATELVGVASAVRDVRDLLQHELALLGRIEDHERRIAAIETKGP